MIWIFIGAFFEVLWALGLKYATGSIIGIFGIVLCVICSFFCAIQACKKMEVGSAYAIFVGLGAAALTSIDMFINGLHYAKLFLIFILLCGVLGIKIAQNKEG